MSAQEDLIRAGKLDAKQVEKLRGSYQKALETPPVLIWRNSGDVTTMAGLGGTFSWPENPQAPVGTVSFTVTSSDPPQPDGDGNSAGTYTSTSDPPGVGQGNFSGLAFSIVIAPAILLIPQGSNEGRLYYVQGMLTDENWTIYTMHLLNVDSQQDFWAARMSPLATT